MGLLPSGAVGTGQSDIVRIIEAQETERQRLARQMHDGPAQSLTNLILQAEICERLFDTDPAQARVELGNLKNSVNTTFQRVREFILTLRPMMLDDLGLMPTLKQYVQNFEEKTDLSASLTVMGREAQLPSHTEVTIFRMVQELLNNVQAHAHATHAQVSLDFQDRFVVASVEDDGSGFDVDEVQKAIQQRKGLGLHTIQERAEMLGGQVQLDSRIGRGTRVRIELPIPQG
jgi:two-component system sensor histidine kinase DegS